MILFDIQHLKSSDAVFGSRPSKYFEMEYPALFRQLIWKALQRKRLPNGNPCQASQYFCKIIYKSTSYYHIYSPPARIAKNPQIIPIA